VVCRARVTDVKAIGEQARVSARFLDLPPVDKERLELFVFDAVLAQLR
jgi:c-di-GMP-binding flagellar brake protein YcgR